MAAVSDAGQGSVAAVVRGHRSLLLIAPLLPALLAAAWVLLRPPLYSSTMVLSVNRAELQSFSADARDSASVELTTVARLMRSPAFMSMLFGQTGSDGVGGHQSPQSLLEHLSIKPVPGTRLLELDYKDDDPDVPARVLDHFVTEFLAYREQAALQRLRRETIAVADRIRQLSGGFFAEQGLVSEMPDGWLPVADAVLARPTVQRVEEALMRHLLADYERALAGEARLAVVDPASEPRDLLSRQFAPLSAGLYGLTMALLLAGLWVRPYLDPSAAFPDRLARRLGAPLAGMLPVVPESVMESARLERRIPDHDGYLESLRTLRTHLILAGKEDRVSGDHLVRGRRGDMMLVTGSIRGEGRTTVARDLALMTGQVQRVLLVDANLRPDDREAVFCGLHRTRPGLSHVLAGAAPLHRCIHRLDDEGIDVMPAGVEPPNSQELLSSNRFSRVLEVFRRRYDLIIIDAPVLNEHSDALLLAGHAQRIVHVIKPGMAGVGDTMSGFRLLRSATRVVPALVCTCVDPGLLQRYGYPQWLGGRNAYRYRKPGGRYLANG